jgi:hypothetical protein
MIRSQKSRVMLLIANVMQQIKYLLKLIVVLLGLRAQKALFTPANYYINYFILIRFYKKYVLINIYLCIVIVKFKNTKNHYYYLCSLN